MCAILRLILIAWPCPYTDISISIIAFSYPHSQERSYMLWVRNPNENVTGILGSLVYSVLHSVLYLCYYVVITFNPQPLPPKLYSYVLMQSTCLMSLVCFTDLMSPCICRYAKIHIPIIASVSEHQPTTWVSFFFDLHILVCTFPAGLWFCIKNINDERVFGKMPWPRSQRGPLMVMLTSVCIYFCCL